MSEINIKGKDKAAILAALYNRAEPRGLGHLHFKQQDMGRAEAEELYSETPEGIGVEKGAKYFDYVHGRCIEVKFTDSTLTAAGFDREYGEGAAEALLRAKGLM
jgi:hypothetical protein